MILIPLSRGLSAMVDDEDGPSILAHKWQAQENKMGGFYAARVKAGRKIYMHRQVTRAQRGTKVDHHNHDGLDNRRHNLRICTHQQNMRNMRRGRGASPYKGVARNRFGGWRAYICVAYRQRHLCIYPTETAAALAYNTAATAMFGEFAKLNQIAGAST